MLPVWLPIALGGRGKRSTLHELSYEERLKISDRLRTLINSDKFSSGRNFLPDDNVLVRPRSSLHHGHFRESRRRISRKLTPTQKMSVD